MMKSKSRSGKASPDAGTTGGGERGGNGGGATPVPQAAAFRRIPRKNGWNCPPHILQVVAWFFLIVFNVFYFGVVVPVLPFEWQPAGYIIVAISVLCHVIAHVTCLTINPGDPSTFKRKKNREMPSFDRKAHAHVIENNHCYLCEVNVDKSSKHCSACNKCVIGFDHHCKWLNSCIGSRNYRMFIACLVTAFVCCLIVCIVTLYVTIIYWVNPVLLHPSELEARRMGEPFSCQISSTTQPVTSSSANNSVTPACDFHENLAVFAPVTGTVFFTVVVILAVLLLVSLFLLGHLLCFHMFLISQGLGTYDYIVRQRMESQEDQTSNVRQKDGSCSCGSKHRSGKVAPATDGNEDIEMQRSKKENSELGRENSMTHNSSLQESVSVDIPRETAVTIHQDGKDLKSGRSANMKPKKKKKKKMTPRALPSPPSHMLHQGYLQHPLPVSAGDILPPPPLPITEETWMYPPVGGGLGAGIAPTETYIEQHIVRRFSIPIMQGAGAATPMSYPLHTSSSVNELIPLSARSTAPSQALPVGRAVLPPLRQQISMGPPTPALDYHSSSAESLQELPMSERAPSQKLEGMHDMSASYPPTSIAGSPLRGKNKSSAHGESVPTTGVKSQQPKKKREKPKLKALKLRKKKAAAVQDADESVAGEEAGPRPHSSDHPDGPVNNEKRRESSEDATNSESAAPTVPLLDLSGLADDRESDSREGDRIIPPPSSSQDAAPQAQGEDEGEEMDEEVMRRINRRRSLMLMR